ncbi:MAG: SusC/RagA family TonB-linked outer membrane protein [Bacteroidales bacterium]
MKRFVLLLFCLSYVSLNVFAQQQIRGRVTEVGTQEPILGASVVIKDYPEIGTTTDLDGYYSLENIPDDASAIEVSYVGMHKQYIAIKSRDTINITLKPKLTELDRVIVAGVAVETSPEKMTVSVERLDADRLSQVPSLSASTSLQGKVAGVNVTQPSGQPGSGATIQLRGATSMIGSQEPLIIVDGTIFQGNLGDIGSDDIESIEVVKGASASALYGSQAGNGVVVINTKRGDQLEEDETAIEIRNELGVSYINNYIDLAEHHQYSLKDPDNPGDTYTDYAGVYFPENYSHGSHPEILGSRGIDPDHYVDNLYAFTNDLQKQFFKRGQNSVNYVGISRKTEGTNFHLSFENNQQGGIIEETEGYNRKTFRANIDVDLADYLTVSTSNMFSNVLSKNPGGVNLFNGGAFFDVLFTLPDVDLTWENEENEQPYDLDPSYWNSQETNPLYQVANIEEELQKNIIIGNYEAIYNPVSSIDIAVNYSFDRRTTNHEELEPYDYLVKGSTKGILNKSKGSLYNSNSLTMNQTLQATAHFSKKFDDWNTNFKLSYLFEDYHYKFSSIYGTKFSVSGNPTLDAISGEHQASSYEETVKAENVFGIAQLDYKAKYLFDVMYRYDGSSKFGEDTRWHSYYRISGGWRLTEDINIPGFQELKFRAAYGTSGQRPGYAAQYETYTVNPGGNYFKSTFGNKNLQPSTTKETEIAMDASFLESFKLNVSYSLSETKDVFMERNLPAYHGWNTQWDNAGAMESEVYEASLRANIIQSDHFSWSSMITFDHIRTKITDLDVPPKLIGTEAQESKAFYLRENETFGIIYGEKFLTSVNELPEGVNKDDYTVNSDGYVILKGTEGTVLESPVKMTDEEGNAEQVKIGDTNPDFNMGFSNTFKFWGVTLYALVDWQYGGDVYNRTRQWLYRDNRAGDLDQYGKPENAKKTYDYYSSLYNVNRITSEFVEDASYIKIREAAVYYNFNLSQSFIRELKIGLIGRNLYTFTDYKGYDPEVAMPKYAESGVPGSSYYKIDAYSYPNHATISGSLTIKF